MTHFHNSKLLAALKQQNNRTVHLYLKRQMTYFASLDIDWNIDLMGDMIDLT